MFRIKVHNLAPDKYHHMEFWCNYLEGTHWRKFGDYAEIVIESVDNRLYPPRLECICKPFNNKYNLWGTKVRDFPVGDDAFWGNQVDVEDIAKHGFHFVHGAIQSNCSVG